ncbi:hypothetical protein [Halovenus salina]|uniref:Uncharacterized protein n=1 Tax=Halovenus salina TaxID=1510225 RepID=A0ABD5VWX2_9EURY|nr:hypothetical protein [Halovenus salina]
MLGRLVEFGPIPLLLWAVAMVHQLGHYYSGGRIVGVPRSEMKLVSPLVPRYLALRGEGEWVSPHEFDQYRTCYERHEPSYENLERFVTGGEIVQTLVVVPVAFGVSLAGFRSLGGSLLLCSIAVTLLYVTVDAVRTWRSGSISGDYSALWHVSARVPVLLLIAFLSVHLSVFFLLAQSV